MSTPSEDPDSWEISFLDRQSFDAATASILIDVLVSHGWPPGEIEKRINWAPGKFEEWIAKDAKEVAECCEVLYAVLRHVGKAPARTLDEPAGVEVSGDLLASPATSPRYPDHDPSQQVAEAGFDLAEMIRSKRLISFKASFAGVLESIRSDPEGSKEIVESAKRMLERILEIAGK